jgi:maltooligosyltrehalose trehalohydrolase
VRRFLLDNAIMWMRDYHMDGLRLDAVHAFVDRSAINFLEQLSQEVKVLGASLGRELVVIAESDLNDPRLVTPREAGGYGMDAQWSDDFHHALFTVLSREALEGAYYSDFGSFAQLAKALERTFVYDGLYSHYRHRVHGRPVGNLSQHHFIGFIQDHDQVGNRAVGDRTHQIAGFDRAKVAAAIVLTSPFIPMLFQGEEWAASSPFQFFADHEDPEMARLVSEGRKREFAAFGWNPESIPDPEKRETFEHSKLSWNEIDEPEHAGMLAWYRDLIRLRRTTPCLNDGEPGNTRVCFDEQQKWLLIQRGAVSVCCNLGASDHDFEMRPCNRLALASSDGVSAKENSISLPPDTVAILVRG